MNMNSIGLYWRTVRHLTLRQVGYQVLHRLRPPARLHLPKTAPTAYFVAAPPPGKPISWQQDEFPFLNQPHRFTGEIDWNYAAFGKLWTYNLNYFDFLNQPDMSAETGLGLMRNFIRQTAALRDGLEAYPTSVRIQNWAQFLSRHQIQDDEINRHLFAQVRLLSHRVEYHIGGNHLLENGFALLTGAFYFQNQRLFSQASRLLRRELSVQLLADGGHIERSPMYHQLLLDRVLDALLMLQHQSWLPDPNLTPFLTEKAIEMLGWLNAITFHNGDVPMVNDAAPGKAPATAQLRAKAIRAGLSNPNQTGLLTDSGYRMLRPDAPDPFRYELFADVGAVGPDYQPGHAHADTLSFVLYVDNQPAFVDNGTSTYQPGPRRLWERGTVAHNTVTVAETNSSEVWASFRVGRRTRVNVLTDTATTLTARHDGYRQLGIVHERSWHLKAGRIVITDQLLSIRTKAKINQPGAARFYSHPTVPVQVLGNVVRVGPVEMLFQSATKPTISVKACELANGFNQLIQSLYVEVAFAGSLETILTLPNDYTSPDLLL